MTEAETPPAESWCGGDKPEWQAPELPLDDDRVLVFDADDALAADACPVYLTD